MYMILTSSKDTYITNKILGNKIKATDANVGRAGTLDLFKLFGESKLLGTGSQYELSRLLIKFDYSAISASHFIDISDPSFTALLELEDVQSGLPNPVNFNVVCFPLAQKFDEGVGRDTATFGDLGAANFVTASFSDTDANLWFASGANQQGLLGSNDIDIISSGNLLDGGGIVNLYRKKFFTTGKEKLSIDVTKVVSGQMAGLIPNHGFRLSFSGSYLSPHPGNDPSDFPISLPSEGAGEELNNKTYFVKRFGSRHARKFSLVPKMVIKYDDSIIDNQDSFFFDLSGSLFLNNYHRGAAANILSGTDSLSEVKGRNCLLLKIESGSFQKIITGSQHFYGTSTDKPAVGVYSASFLIPSQDSTTVLSSNNSSSTIKDFVRDSGSIKFNAYWSSMDETVSYLSSSVTITQIDRSASPDTVSDYVIKLIGLKPKYFKTEDPIIKVFVFDRIAEDKIYKSSYNRTSVKIEKMYYSVVDAISGEVIIPFSTNSTQVSSSGEGMYFSIDIGSFPTGIFKFKFMITENNQDIIYDNNSTFKVI